MFERFGADPDCRCRPTVTDGTLVVASDDCPGSGRLADADACRATVIDALDQGVSLVRTEADGITRSYADDAASLLVAAGRFVTRVEPHDAALAARARRRPIAAGRVALGRAGPVGRLVAATGLAECVARGDECVAPDDKPARGRDRDTGREPADRPTDDQPPCAAKLRPATAPTVALGRVQPWLPPTARLQDRFEVTGGVVRRYETDGPRDLLQFAPCPIEYERAETLAAAYDRLARGRTETPGAAVRAVTTTGADRLTAILRRHTRGLGYLAPLLATPGVTDLTVTADTAVRAELAGASLTTNVRVSPTDTATLASRVRATSGDGLSRADPTADATIDGVRVAAVTEPAADATRFALRTARDERAWTLPRLIASDTLPPRAAGLLALALERGVTLLIAGPRGAGKTSLLAACLWQLRATTRSVVIEDTRELPTDRLRDHGREVTHLAVGTSEGAALTPAEAVRTALRLGDGALVVGEVRGEEAAALYEAMRVGSAADTVLGTIHGADPAAVRERVVTDLGVPPSAFTATDAVVTLASDHRLSTVAEVRGDDDISFAPLFTREESEPNTARETGDAARAPDGSTRATGVIDRGESHLLTELADGTYADARSEIAERADRLRRLAAAGLTQPSELDATLDGPDGTRSDPDWADGRRSDVDRTRADPSVTRDDGGQP